MPTEDSSGRRLVSSQKLPGRTSDECSYVSARVLGGDGEQYGGSTGSVTNSWAAGVLGAGSQLILTVPP